MAPGEFPDRHDGARLLQAVDGAAHFGVPAGDFDAEGDRLPMNAVRAPHHQRVAHAAWPSAASVRRSIGDILQKKIRRFHHLDGQRGIQHVGRGQPHDAGSAIPVRCLRRPA